MSEDTKDTKEKKKQTKIQLALAFKPHTVRFLVNGRLRDKIGRIREGDEIILVWDAVPSLQRVIREVGK